MHRLCSLETSQGKCMQDWKRCGWRVLKCPLMAACEAIRPIVEGYEREILARHRWENNEEVAKYGHKGVKKRVILEPKDAWLLDEADFKIYDQECKAARDKAGLKVEDDGFCPLLVAEDLECKAKRVFIEAMQPITGLDPDDVLCGPDGVKNYDKLVDLSLRLLAPFVGSAADILKK